MERRLAAILAADVVGYSRLMQEDESGTLNKLRAFRSELLEPLVAKRFGRIFKVAGDGFLVEFSSAVNAVECAAELQQQLHDMNSNQAEDPRVILRIGVNLGDVIVEGTDLYGDGINIAARLEGIAEPGGVLISGAAFDQIKNKVDIIFSDQGFRTVKNIIDPIRVYQAEINMPRSVPVPTSVADKPSIAVLPLTNMSGDSAQQYFNDGITEDIITELARARQIHVLSRNSSFQYAGKSVDVIKVGRDLGVQYLLEGSIRRVGNNIRITAQLIDTATGNHLWAERFDRNQEDIFAVQDQLVRRIVSTLVGRVQAAGLEKAKRKPPANLSAYECVLQADALPFDDPEAVKKARELYQKAIELDPNYARAHALLGLNIRHEWLRDMSGSVVKLDQAYALMRKAIALDENDSLCHEVMAWIQLDRGADDLAEHHYDKAAELNPSRPVTVAGKGALLTLMGRPEEGLEHLREARQLDPFFNPSWYWREIAIAHFVCHRYPDAVIAIKRSANLSYAAHAYLSACYSLTDQIFEAQKSAAEVLRLLPDFVSNTFVVKQGFRRAEDRQHLSEGLQKAGLPD